jgi:hypothetical protein
LIQAVRVCAFYWDVVPQMIQLPMTAALPRGGGADSFVVLLVLSFLRHDDPDRH